MQKPKTKPKRKGGVRDVKTRNERGRRLQALSPMILALLRAYVENNPGLTGPLFVAEGTGQRWVPGKKGWVPSAYVTTRQNVFTHRHAPWVQSPSAAPEIEHEKLRKARMISGLFASDAFGVRRIDCGTRKVRTIASFCGDSCAISLAFPRT